MVRKLYKAAGNSGFSLLELLIAVFISASVAVVLGASLSAGFKLWSRAKLSGAWASDTVFAVETVARQLRQGVSLRDSGLDGTNSTLSFVSIKAGRILRYNYSYDHMNHELLVCSDSLERITGDFKCKPSEVVLKDIDDLRLSYMREFFSDEGFEWQDSWERGLGSPAAVMIEGSCKGQKFSKNIFIPSYSWK